MGSNSKHAGGRPCTGAGLRDALPSEDETRPSPGGCRVLAGKKLQTRAPAVKPATKERTSLKGQKGQTADEPPGPPRRRRKQPRKAQHRKGHRASKQRAESTLGWTITRKRGLQGSSATQPGRWLCWQVGEQQGVRRGQPARRRAPGQEAMLEEGPSQAGPPRKGGPVGVPVRNQWGSN